MRKRNTTFSEKCKMKRSPRTDSEGPLRRVSCAEKKQNLHKDNYMKIDVKTKKRNIISDRQIK